MKRIIISILLTIFSALSYCYSQTLASDNTLEVLTWNIEWFGSTASNKGPKNKKKQMQVASQVIFDLGQVDVIMFEEICDSALFKKLADTTGYNFYLSPGSNSIQKIGLFYSKSLEIIEKPNQILMDHKSTFAQRQPVRFTFKHSKIGEVTVIGLHLKAHIPSATEQEQQDSYNRRKESALLIQNYIKSNLDSKKVIVLGDWNDDVDVSNYNNQETPFRSIIDDSSLRYVTFYLSFAMIQSSKYGSVIDHICISNELFSCFRSSAVVGVKDKFKKYIEECSDHYPVYSVFE